MRLPVAVTFGSDTKVVPYEAALRDAGLEPIRVAPGERMPDDVAGLVITGGDDVDPALYGEERHPETQVSDDRRDRTELDAASRAVNADFPTLAICRGMQVLNVALGGTLVQHLDNASVHKVRPASDTPSGEHPPVHQVIVAAGSRLASIIGDGHHDVNSRHHQALGKLGRGLRVSATAGDGVVIEAVEMPDRSFVLGVQWHPEDRVGVSEIDRRLFGAFATAVGKSRSCR